MTRQKTQVVSQLRYAVGDAFLPMLAAVGVLVGTRTIDPTGGGIAAAGGALVAIARLWVYTPWAQRSLASKRGRGGRR